MERKYQIGTTVYLPNDKEGRIIQYLDNEYDDWDWIYLIDVYGEGEEVKMYTQYTLDDYN